MISRFFDPEKYWDDTWADCEWMPVSQEKHKCLPPIDYWQASIAAGNARSLLDMIKRYGLLPWPGMYRYHIDGVHTRDPMKILTYLVHKDFNAASRANREFALYVLIEYVHGRQSLDALIQAAELRDKLNSASQ